MSMKYVKPHKLKMMMLMFFGTGIFGIVIGLGISGNDPIFMMTLMGVINLCMGGLVGWLFLTQEPSLRDKRKSGDKRKN